MLDVICGVYILFVVLFRFWIVLGPVVLESRVLCMFYRVLGVDVAGVVLFGGVRLSPACHERCSASRRML